jgi:hypothetical protein
VQCCQKQGEAVAGARISPGTVCLPAGPLPSLVARFPAPHRLCLASLRRPQVKHLQPIPTNPDGTPALELPSAAASAELKDLSESLQDTQVGGWAGRECAALAAAGAQPAGWLATRLQPSPGCRCARPGAASCRLLESPLLALPPCLRVVQPAGALVGKCRTLDQAKAVVTFLDAASGELASGRVGLAGS